MLVSWKNDWKWPFPFGNFQKSSELVWRSHILGKEKWHLVMHKVWPAGWYYILDSWSYFTYICSSISSIFLSICASSSSSSCKFSDTCNQKTKVSLSCNGIVSHGAPTGGIQVLVNPHVWKQMQTKCTMTFGHMCYSFAAFQTCITSHSDCIRWRWPRAPE